MPSTPSTLFYEANIIDYIRMLLIIISVGLEGSLFLITYSISIFLDYLDGMVARYFRRISLLGKILDMVIDRTSTVIILFKISNLAQDLSCYCLFYAVLDILGHFFYFNYHLIKGTNHKETSRIMRLYYYPPVLMLVCTLAEVGFMFLYANRYVGSDKNNSKNFLRNFISNILEKIFKTFILIKGFINVIQLIEGIELLSKL